MEKLTRLTDRIWIFPYEEARDRPNLGYIRGDRWAMAVDAGHSEDHTGSFYRAIEAAGLPLPSLTVLTHWHWDHTFGMHAVHGLCLANERTNAYLKVFRNKIKSCGTGFFLAMDETIQREYMDQRPVIVSEADMVYSGEMMLDAGSCPIRVFQAQSPHTDDSTLIEVPGEKTLFLGDATCGALPTWEKEPVLCKKLAEAIRSTSAEICLLGHWTPLSRSEVLEELQEDA